MYSFWAASPAGEQYRVLKIPSTTPVTAWPELGPPAVMHVWKVTRTKRGKKIRTKRQLRRTCKYYAEYGFFIATMPTTPLIYPPIES